MLEWQDATKGLPPVGSDVLVYMPGRHQKLAVEHVYRDAAGEPIWGYDWRQGEARHITHWAAITNLPDGDE